MTPEQKIRTEYERIRKLRDDQERHIESHPQGLMSLDAYEFAKYDHLTVRVRTYREILDMISPTQKGAN